MITAKVCSTCRLMKPIEDFYRDSHSRDGRGYKCKPCSREASITHYYAVRDAKKEEWKRRKQRPEYAAIMLRAVQAYEKRNPEKIAAHIAVKNAIRAGKIKRGSCQECGTPRAHAHHHDYSKPFDVEWLCLPCHRREHRRTAVGIALAAEGK